MNLRVRRRPPLMRNLQSCQRQVMHAAVSCKLPARVCSLVCCRQHVTGFFSTCAVHQVSQISHSVLSVLDTQVVSERQCSRSSRHHLSATLGASYFMQYLYQFRHTCRFFCLCADWFGEAQRLSLQHLWSWIGCQPELQSVEVFFVFCVAGIYKH